MGSQDARTAVVGDGADGASALGAGRGQHGVRDFFGRATGDGTDGGARAAQKRAQSASGFGGGNDVVEERNQFFAERLMKMIRERATERLIFARSEGGGDRAGIAGIVYSVEAIDPRWEEGTGGGGRDLE